MGAVFDFSWSVSPLISVQDRKNIFEKSHVLVPETKDQVTQRSWVHGIHSTEAVILCLFACDETGDLPHFVALSFPSGDVLWQVTKMQVIQEKRRRWNALSLVAAHDATSYWQQAILTKSRIFVKRADPQFMQLFCSFHWQLQTSLCSNARGLFLGDFPAPITVTWVCKMFRNQEHVGLWDSQAHSSHASRMTPRVAYGIHLMIYYGPYPSSSGWRTTSCNHMYITSCFGCSCVVLYCCWIVDPHTVDLWGRCWRWYSGFSLWMWHSAKVWKRKWFLAQNIPCCTKLHLISQKLFGLMLDVSGCADFIKLSQLLFQKDSLTAKNKICSSRFVLGQKRTGPHALRIWCFSCLNTEKKGLHLSGYGKKTIVSEMSTGLGMISEMQKTAVDSAKSFQWQCKCIVVRFLTGRTLI